MRQSWDSHETVMRQSWDSHKTVMRQSWDSHRQSRLLECWDPGIQDPFFLPPSPPQKKKSLKNSQYAFNYQFMVPRFSGNNRGWYNGIQCIPDIVECVFLILWSVYFWYCWECIAFIVESVLLILLRVYFWYHRRGREASLGGGDIHIQLAVYTVQWTVHS